MNEWIFRDSDAKRQIVWNWDRVIGGSKINKALTTVFKVLTIYLYYRYRHFQDKFLESRNFISCFISIYFMHLLKQMLKMSKINFKMAIPTFKITCPLLSLRKLENLRGEIHTYQPTLYFFNNILNTQVKLILVWCLLVFKSFLCENLHF